MPAYARNLTIIALTCVMAVLLCLVQTASAVAAKSPEKTASGIFFADPNIYTGEILPESQQPQWEIDPTATPTASGRQVWLSADPIGEKGGPNIYAYVMNEPISSTDPFGLWTFGTGTTIQGGVGGGGGVSLGFYIGHDSDCGIFDGWSSGILGSGELGIQSPGASAAPFVAFSNADTVDQLKGLGMVLGASGGGVQTAGITVGFEHSRGLTTDSRGFPTGLNGVTGGQVTVGPGAWALWSPLPIEGHGGASYTVGPTIGAKDGGCP